MYLWQQEEVHNSYLIMVGYTPDLDSPNRVEAPALITGVGYVQSMFGYPNEEAFWKDPRMALGHGCYEIIGSSWAAHIDDYNRRSFGFPWPGAMDLHHYFVGSKDTSCQILARELRVQVFPGEPFRAVVEASHRRPAEERRALSEQLANDPEYRNRQAAYKEAVRERYGQPPVIDVSTVPPIANESESAPLFDDRLTVAVVAGVAGIPLTGGKAERPCRARNVLDNDSDIRSARRHRPPLTIPELDERMLGGGQT